MRFMADELERRWSISFNANLINKTPPKHAKSFVEGFEVYDVTLDEFIEVLTKGIGFSYVFDGGIRKAQNFQMSDCLCVDVDGGLRLGDAEVHPFVKEFASFIYTTPSHTSDIHRFRIVFLLEQSIEDATELTFATRALAQMLGGDLSVSDPARLFYGNSEARVIQLGHVLPSESVAQLITEGDAITKQKRRLAFTGTPTSRFTANTQFTTESGECVTADQVTEKTVVRCPFHLDNHPSSFLALNDHGDVYHYCSVCCVTRWAPQRQQGSQEDDFVETMRKLSQSTDLKIFERGSRGLEQFMVGGRTVVPAVAFSSERYLPDFEIAHGVVFVRSPKGSGKTEFVKREVARLKNRHQTFEEFEEASWDGDDRLYSDTSILLLGHRQALIGEMCSRVGLNSYLDDHDLSDGELIERRKRYGICLDSLQKLRNTSYDVIIIDEVQQVLAHFLSDTLRGKRLLIWSAFVRLIGGAKKIIALDADLSWSAFHTLLSVRDKDTASFVRINEWVSGSPQEIDVYGSRDHLIQKLSDFVSEGKRVFVTSNSKSLILKAAEMMSTSKKASGESVKSFHITSENSKSLAAQEFIQNVKQEILKYDVVLASPSLGTGVDISFPSDAQLVDVVVGLFVGGVTDHRDIDQQLLRVRNPKQVCVWIDPSKDNLETDYDAIMVDLKERHLQSLLEGGIADDPSTDSDQLFISMVARIVRDRHMSLNYLKLNFLGYKQDQGWSINFVTADKGAAKVGRQRVKAAAGQIQQRRIEAINHAPCLSLYDYLRVDDRINRIQLPISDELRHSYIRTRIELFFRCDITEELIRQDLEEGLRGKLSLYRRLTDQKYISDLLGSGIDLAEDMSANLMTEPTCRDLVLARMFVTTPIYQNFLFLTGIEITKDQLIKFADEAKLLTSALRVHAGIRVRGDVDMKPMLLLSKLLDLVGLKLIKTRSSGKTGVKQYFYALDVDRKTELDGLLRPMTDERELELATKYPDMADRYKIGWCYLTEKYGHQFNPGQLRWMFPGVDRMGELRSRNVLSGHEKWAASVGLR